MSTQELIDGLEQGVKDTVAEYLPALVNTSEPVARNVIESLILKESEEQVDARLALMNSAAKIEYLKADARVFRIIVQQNHDMVETQKAFLTAVMQVGWQDFWAWLSGTVL